MIFSKGIILALIVGAAVGGIAGFLVTSLMF